MCGNFGLLIVKPSSSDVKPNENPFNTGGSKIHDPHAELNISIRRSIHEVGRNRGIRVAEDDVQIPLKIVASEKMEAAPLAHHSGESDKHSDDCARLMLPISILQNQTACTEARGGQAGGISYLDFCPNYKTAQSSSVFDDQFSSLHDMEPLVTRVRMVANKRTPLADELASLFMEKQLLPNSSMFSNGNTADGCQENSIAITALGHTRFATSSINVDSELHPHEWEQFHREFVWRFNPVAGRMEKVNSLVGVHITHNGDFDELSAYSNKMVNEEVGWWLERVLHCGNDASGDSPKIAGFMDLSRVQGRWSAAARLAYVRCICKNNVDEVTGDSNIPLSKSAPNVFPPIEYFEAWGHFFESVWIEHMNNIIKSVAASAPMSPTKQSAPSVSAAASVDDFNVDSSASKGHAASLQYRVDRKNMKQFCKVLVKALHTMDYATWKANLNPTATSVHRSSMHDYFGRNLFASIEDGFDPDKIMKLSTHGNSRHGHKSSMHGSSRHGQSSTHGASRHGHQVSTDGASRNDAGSSTRADDSVPEEVDTAKLLYYLDGTHWTSTELKSFVYATVRGFLFADLYTALTEFLSRAQGSFGLQVHSTLEPGVIVVASKGQPMSLAFDPKYPIVLSGSEAEAVAVPVSKDGNHWCKYRLDLDAKGEIVRVGLPRALIEGSFSDIDGGINKVKNWNKINSRLYLGTVNIELKSYSLTLNCESNGAQLLARTIDITTSASLTSVSTPRMSTTAAICASVSGCLSPLLSSSSGEYGGVPVGMNSSKECAMPAPAAASEMDMVAEDLSMIPSVLAAIDRAWVSTDSVEYRAADSLSRDLCACMVKRISNNLDTIDFLIAGVEVSLWIAEQFAADMRLIFPQLNVSTISANKLLSYMPGGGNFSKVPYFPGTENITSRRIDRNTCILLISQSGQTFPTLHATRVLCSHSPVIDISKIWLMTGCFNSKMELVLKEAYAANKLKRHSSSRVFNNYAGYRPAEPSSVAVVASMHSLTRLLLHVTKYIRKKHPTGRLVPAWAKKREYAVAHAALIIWRYYQRHRATLLENRRKNRRFPRSAALSPQSSSWGAASAASNSKEKIIMTVSDGCIADMSSLLLTCLIPDVVNIVGFDILGCPAECTGIRSSGIGDKSQHDKSLHNCTVTSGASILNKELVTEGRRLSRYITEYYRMHFLVGCYVVLAVGFGLPLFGSLGSIVLAVMHSNPNYVLSFSPRTLHSVLHQPLVYSVVGLVLQILDALLIIYCLRLILVMCRIADDIPVFARFGKRTLVVVDTPCIHQLLESFVSKLFSQSFGYNAIDVHGANGLDHFVHKYTHRVTRGVLIAVGRCDGRLCCLAKSEASSLLACKQAAFIQNPLFVSPPGAKTSILHRLYLHFVSFLKWIHSMRKQGKQQWCSKASHIDSTLGIGHGPEFVTIGHNPYSPDLGDSATHIVLPSNTRKKFVDEYLYERLFLAVKPFPGAILRRLSTDYQNQTHDVSVSVHVPEATECTKTDATLTANPLAVKNGVPCGRVPTQTPSESIVLPYGVHFINPLLGQGGLLFPDFVMSFRDILSRKHSGHDETTNNDRHGDHLAVTNGKEKSNEGNAVVKPFNRQTYSGKSPVLDTNSSIVEKQIAMSNNPGVRVAFTHKLDSDTQAIQDSQFVVQCFYENRVAAVERYISFCIMFHSMAHHTRLVSSYYPAWLNWIRLTISGGSSASKGEHLWDITRSQSNLRIATTGKFQCFELYYRSAVVRRSLLDNIILTCVCHAVFVL